LRTFFRAPIKNQQTTMTPRPDHKSQVQSVITLRAQGASFSVIAKKTGVPKATAHYLWEKFNTKGTTQDLRAGGGRPSLLTPNLARKLTLAITATPDATAVELHRRIKDSVSPRSLRRYRRALGFKQVKGKPKTPLTEKQCAIRRDWCRQHLNDPMENVVWTDEKPFVLGRRTRLFWKCRGEPDPEYLRFKHPQKVMIWGGISRRGKTTLHFAKGTINAKKYTAILQDHLLGPASNLYPEGFVLQHDRATPHKAKLTSKWLAQKGVPSILTPPNSPELNPIELVWHIMESRIGANPPRTKQGLVRAIKKEWRRLTQEEIDRCILHAQNLRGPILRDNGGHPKNISHPRKRC